MDKKDIRDKNKGELSEGFKPRARRLTFKEREQQIRAKLSPEALAEIEARKKREQAEQDEPGVRSGRERTISSDLGR